MVLEFVECECAEGGFDELLGSVLVQVHVGSEGLRACLQVGPASLSLEDHDVVMGMAVQALFAAHDEQFGREQVEKVEKFDRAARRRAARRRAARSHG